MAGKFIKLVNLTLSANHVLATSTSRNIKKELWDDGEMMTHILKPKRKMKTSLFFHLKNLLWCLYCNPKHVFIEKTAFDFDVF